MNEGSLVIPKKKVPVTLWVHPEGRVKGNLFVHLPGPDTGSGEQPCDVMNEARDFIAVEREDPDELRFYNKSSIVRVQYLEQMSSDQPEGRVHPCCITLMDGSLIEAEICKITPEERSRLYDYMNDAGERFLKVRTGGSEVMLINKSYVVYISAAVSRAYASANASLALVA